MTIAVHQNCDRRIKLSCLHRIVADISVNGINSVVYIKRSVCCNLFAVALGQKTLEADEAVVVAEARLIGIHNPCVCINSESFLGNLIAGIQLSDVNCPDDRADIVINIRQSGSIGDRKLLPEHILVHGILIECQFDGFAAA